jgi:hypothetical protein
MNKMGGSFTARHLTQSKYTLENDILIGSRRDRCSFECWLREIRVVVIDTLECQLLNDESERLGKILMKLLWNCDEIFLDCCETVVSNGYLRIQMKGNKIYE